MRRVALLVSSMNQGGAERVAATLSNAWAARGDEVFLIPTYLGDVKLEFPLHSGVRFMPLRDHMGAQGGRAATVRKLLALRRMIRTLAPDVVVSFLTNVNVVALLALAGSRVPLVVSERADPTGSVDVPVALRVARTMLYQFADAFVAQTEGAATRYRAQLLRPPATSVIPNPLPPALHETVLRASQEEGREIVTLGRLASEKRFDLLIRAFAQAFPSDSSWRLTIWGKGPLQQPLQRLIADLALEGRVRLPGATADPWTVLAAAQVFVLTSLYEGFPNAMLEAMALGLPCIAFDCPSGPRELSLDGELAVLVRTGDVNALVQALRSLAANRQRRVQLGHGAAESVRARFSEPVVLAAWDALFGRLCR